MGCISHHISVSCGRPAHPLCRADARLKVAGAVIVLAMVITAPGITFPLVLSAISLGLAINIGVSPKTLLFRFSEPVFIAAVVLLLKLLSTGSHAVVDIHLFGLEIVGYREGLEEGLRIASRILGAVSVLAVVGFSTPFTDLMAALSWFRVPQVLVDVAMFAWRYLFLLLEEAQVVYQAQKNRLGYIGYRRGLRSFGTLAGILVIKAFDNSQQITTAMVQRGYDGNLPLLRHRPFIAAEVLMFVIVVAVMLGVRTLPLS